MWRPQVETYSCVFRSSKDPVIDECETVKQGPGAGYEDG